MSNKWSQAGKIEASVENGVEWTSQYNVHRAQLGFITVVVAWDSMQPKNSPEIGYKVTVSGAYEVRAKKHYSTLSEAKLVGLRIAKRQLLIALEALTPLDPATRYVAGLGNAIEG